MKEAEAILGEAEIKAEKILDAAHRRMAKLAEDIRGMKEVRSRLAASVRSAIESHLKLVEGLEADAPDDPILEGKVAYLTRGPNARSERGGG